MKYKILLSKHPNNETRLCLFPSPTPRESLLEKACAILGVTTSEVEEKHSTVKRTSENFSSLDIRSEFRTICQAHEYKRTKFGLFAKRRIMRAGGAMDKHDPNPSNYLFMTATLPGNDDWSKWAIANDAHHLVDGLKSWLSKKQGNRLEFYVWEHQKRGALHLHYCVYIPDPAIRKAVQSQFARQWIRLLDGTEKRTGVSVWGKHAVKTIDEKLAVIQTCVQEVHTSVAAYMSGYCGGTMDKHEKDNSYYWYPKRWYGISRPLSSLIKSLTETEEIEYSNYRDAKICLMGFEEHFDYGSLQPRKYPHLVGHGESVVFYHSPKTANELWQSRKTMKYFPATHPHVSSFIKECISIQSTFLELEMSSQLFRGLCSKKQVSSLRDGLLLDSLRRGSLNLMTVQSIEALYMSLSSVLNLPPTLEKLSKQLQRFALLHSQIRHLMEWNKHGWLCNVEDFPGTVDISRKKCEHRTTADEVVTPMALISSRGHVPCEENAIFQLDIF